MPQPESEHPADCSYRGQLGSPGLQYISFVFGHVILILFRTKMVLRVVLYLLCFCIFFLVLIYSPIEIPKSVFFANLVCVFFICFLFEIAKAGMNFHHHPMPVMQSQVTVTNPRSASHLSVIVSLDWK